MKTLPTLAISLLALCACATGARISDSDRLALYQAHAGAPVANFHYTGTLDGWTPLGDEAVALWTRPNTAYLITFVGTCTDIEFATGIAVSGQFRTVYSRFDTITPFGAGTHSLPCRIGEIRPLDATAIREAERDIRNGVNEAERAPAQSGGR